MPAAVTTDSVWKEVERRLFAVLAMVTDDGEARSAGIVYAVHERRLYVGTGKKTWKRRWVEGNPNVSLTVTIPKSIPFFPWLKIPDATITLQGEGRVVEIDELPDPARDRLFHGVEVDPAEQCAIVIDPHGRFLTYGVGVSLMTMRKPEESRGSAPV